MNTTETKYFTPKEAQKTLPLVKQIVRDILDVSDKMRNSFLMGGENTDDNPELRENLEKITGFIHELEEIGCYYKDWNFTTGLVDFPSIIDGKEVMLCWRSDEPYILFYHGINEGYDGRKRIPDLLLI